MVDNEQSLVDDVTLRKLTLESIRNFAAIDARITSIELSIGKMSTTSSEILEKIQETLQQLARIQEKQTYNQDEHKVIHSRIDDVKEELDDVNEAIVSVQRTCQSAGHEKLMERIAAIEEQRKKDIKNIEDQRKQDNDANAKTMSEINTQLAAIARALAPLNWNIKGVKVWVVILAMIVLSFLSTITNHREWLKSLVSWLKFWQ